jgi:integrase
VSVGAVLAKVYLWSACRQEEATSLTWGALRVVSGEYHFRVIGKRGVEKWFRVPDGLYRELLQVRADSSYVFAMYNDQLRQLHRNRNRADRAAKVGVEFKPLCLGDWFYDRLAEWSGKQPNGHASPHAFRRTALQFARIGEDINQQVAEDARVGVSVLKKHYISEHDEQLRQKSNRTYKRILIGLPMDLALRLGYVDIGDDLEQRVQAAFSAQNWDLAAALTAQLAKQRQTATG